MTASTMDQTLLTPRYILRRNLALYVLRNQTRGRVLEVGCGHGELLSHLGALGYSGTGFEISPTAAEAAEHRLAKGGSPFRIARSLSDLEDMAFDVLISLEVLEHIEDDHAALRTWTGYTAPGATLLVSVPAYHSKWSVADEYGGHQRRYERRELFELVESAGWTVEHLWTYGFPLTAVTGAIRPFTYAKRMEDVRGSSPHERSLASSFDSTRRLGLLAPVVRTTLEAVGLLGHLLQLPFRHTPLGDGFFLVARRA